MSFYTHAQLGCTRLERYEEALISFDRAISINSDDYNVWKLRGNVLGSLERYEEALISCDRAISINSDDHKAWRLRGNVLGSLERYEEAIKAYKKAIRFDQKSSIVYNSLSRIYVIQGQPQLAIKLLVHAIEANLINDYLTWNNLGFLYLITNNLEKAKISFNFALQRKVNCFIPIFNLALVNVCKNKIKSAKQLIEKSLNFCEDETTTNKLYIAIANIALGKEKDDLQNIKNIVKTAKNSSLSLVQEIRCGVLESAQILSKHPEFSKVKEVVDILENALKA